MEYSIPSSYDVWWTTESYDSPTVDGMAPSSRTPDGPPNRCWVCGNQIKLDPSQPPGDAPCPFCGSLLWFDLWFAAEPIEHTPGRIRIEFRGGCKDGMILDDDPRSLAERNGYRYYRLAKDSRTGTHFRDIPVHEYGKILKALAEHRCPGTGSLRDVADYLHESEESGGLARDLSKADVERIRRLLGNVAVHVYVVTERSETDELILVRLRFVEEVRGV